MLLRSLPRTTAVSLYSYSSCFPRTLPPPAAASPARCCSPALLHLPRCCTLPRCCPHPPLFPLTVTGPPHCRWSPPPPVLPPMPLVTQIASAFNLRRDSPADRPRVGVAAADRQQGRSSAAGAAARGGDSGWKHGQRPGAGAAANGGGSNRQRGRPPRAGGSSRGGVAGWRHGRLPSARVPPGCGAVGRGGGGAISGSDSQWRGQQQGGVVSCRSARVVRLPSGGERQPGRGGEEV